MLVFNSKNLAQSKCACYKTQEQIGEWCTCTICHNGLSIITCVLCNHVSICKVDYMMANNFVYAIITLNYNKVMHIIPESYRVATIAEH